MRHLLILGILFGLMAGALSPVSAQGPTLAVTNPKDGAVVAGDTVTVEFRATDFKIVPSTVPASEFGKRPDANRPGEGHVHLQIDAQPLVIWSSADPYSFKGVAPGDHQLTVELVNNDHSSLTPKVIQTIRFRVGPSTLPVTAEQSAPLPGDRLALLALVGLLGLALGLQLRRRLLAQR